MPVSDAWHQRLAQARLSRQQTQRWRTRGVVAAGTLDFAGNDYLGLAQDPRVSEAQAEGARRFGSGAGASHLVSGHLEIHEALENALARWTGRQRALLFSTGYMANLGVLQALANADTAIFQDRLNHASLLDGATLSGARSRRFHHRDANDLNRLMDRSQCSHKLVVSDGVFSMDGDGADIATLAQVSQRHRAWLMIDDAHGVGVLGDNGSGCVGTRWGSADVPVLVGTLGKALGTAGAFVAGDAALIEHITQFARSYVYTTAQPPSIAAATLKALEIVQGEPEHRDHLNANIAYFRRGALQLGLPLSTSTTPIQPLLLGSEDRTLGWAATLAKHGLQVGAIRPPTVPNGEARLRITLSARHGRRDIDRLLEGLNACQRAEATCHA
ncbi:8-amino-7-oxononanoate synthase [Halomonas janggokensis]|uniref:8-amino-7-oxononanoate synthase n=1 Tax=Vreelandella janggokensis TaxID=370767 RepID=A0ABT4IR72_9GAMM|nr:MULTISPECIES: 8-amino-7-oxononanoate synthase [Halomonas]MCW4150080.1 8-amino-7-oxononanoate synthase [Halomonas sp. 18H]MCZ0926166.1 8-amino-7-oxononanoate synthase [Halomonas janggokensis]MCZ0931233.1 8-amino-7-oxononanoate synthase [Halomonas janggokensis]